MKDEHRKDYVVGVYQVFDESKRFKDLQDFLKRNSSPSTDMVRKIILDSNWSHADRPDWINLALSAGIEDTTVDDTNHYIQRERKAIIYAVIAQFIWAIGVIIIKAGNKCTNFTPNSSMWRSVFMSLITYYTLKQKNIPIIPFSQVKRKYWFLVRTLGTYFCFRFISFHLST